MPVARRPGMATKNGSSRGKEKIRYGVVGLGHITQVAVLPAFAHARENSEVRALVSGDRTKLRKLGTRHGVPIHATYDEFDDLCRSGEIDAVYIALPNHLHREYTERAAAAGIHVLCEKPMATTTADCEAMIDACSRAGVKLMIAYRLHFERANMEAVRVVTSGKIGEPRFFSSDFSQDVRPGDIRLQKEKGGGTLWDIGVYCVNAARYLFRAEPLEAFAVAASRPDPRFDETEEMAAATLRFPDDRLASFVCSFGSSDVASYRVVGTKGDLRVDPAYAYAEGLAFELTVGGKTTTARFPKRDQFAPELLYFSRCVLEDRDAEPSGVEGLIDVRIVEALYESVRTGRPVPLDLPEKEERPTLRQEIRRPPVQKPPRPIGTKSPSR
ncbi:MAG: Gfo/Idh/MocA family protein [Thermoanaerobaculia bacterium]